MNGFLASLVAREMPDAGQPGPTQAPAVAPRLPSRFETPQGPEPWSEEAPGTAEAAGHDGAPADPPWLAKPAALEAAARDGGRPSRRPEVGRPADDAAGRADGPDAGSGASGLWPRPDGLVEAPRRRGAAGGEVGGAPDGAAGTTAVDGAAATGARTRPIDTAPDGPRNPARAQDPPIAPRPAAPAWPDTNTGPDTDTGPGRDEADARRAGSSRPVPPPGSAEPRAAGDGAAAGAPAVVHVSIGRVEIRAVPAPPPARRAEPSKPMGLDEYLRRRGGAR
ncbi:hypothetical protein [Specibacter cremeus]|uniref:hypothetical protein n=1 Tax=Specibacter cremeus TaxID=1629051 RepID=UPI000F7A7017|nr:hypothetical protein [Specibacter cremeus]